jgi:hypothetical protein
MCLLLTGVLSVAALPVPVAAGTAAVTFTDPAPGKTVYRAGATIRVRWLEPASLDVSKRVLVRQRGALDANGGCGDTSSFLSHSSHTIPGSAVTEGSVRRSVLFYLSGHEANRCYRYRVDLTYGDGTVHRSSASGRARIATAWTGSYNLYRSTAFSTQRTYVWCIAAGVQMMRNYVKGESDHGSTTQKRYYDYARSHDRFPNERFDGSDAQGWAAAARYATGASHYGWRAHASYRDSLRYAASSIRRSGKPVGLMVARGGHAWVMTGFDATADPLADASFEVTSVYISGPLYPMQQSNGYDRPPNTRYAYGYLDAYYVPFRSLPGENSELWHGKYVSVTAWSD